MDKPESIMKMATEASRIYFEMEGWHSVNVDWGDGSSNTYMLGMKIHGGEPAKCEHVYSNVAVHTITVTQGDIKSLKCYGGLMSLDVSKNHMLEILVCINGLLTYLDVSKNTALRKLDCSRNQLTDLVISNICDLNCSNNKLTHLNLNKSTSLFSLNCSNNCLAEAALNALFESLHDIYYERTYPYYDEVETKEIYISGNPGIETCNRNIAESKGWTVS